MLAGGALAALLIAAGIGYAVLTPRPAKAPPLAQRASTTSIAGPAAVPEGPPAPAPSLAAAFKVVYPQPVVDISRDGRTYRVHFKPVLVQRISNDTFALVSAGTDPAGAFDQPNGFHADSGYATIAYLAARPVLALQGKPYLITGSDGGWGQPPGLRLDNSLNTMPVLEVTSGYFDWGEGDDQVELYRLGRTIDAVGPISDTIPIRITKDACDVEGTIKPVTPDKVFEVRYSGTHHGPQRYVFSQGSWTADPPLPDEGLISLCPSPRHR